MKEKIAAAAGFVCIMVGLTMFNGTTVIVGALLMGVSIAFSLRDNQ
jgi:hypothetical protein